MPRLALYQEILGALEATKRRDGYADPTAAAQRLKDSSLEFDGMDFWTASQELAQRKKSGVKRRLDRMVLGANLLVAVPVVAIVILVLVEVLNSWLKR